MIPQDAYPSIFEARLGLVMGRLSSYLADPSEDNIHDVRTSIRRMRAAYAVVPLEARTGQSRRTVRRLRRFFRINSTVRDCDIFISKLAAYGHGQGSVHVMALQRKRLSHLMRAMRAAARLSGSAPPQILAGRPDGLLFARRLLPLIRALRGFVPGVLSGSAGPEDLHMMRKTAKKIRYLLELDPGGGYGDITSNIKPMQRLLGDIHDCDMFISYLAGKAKSKAKSRAGHGRDVSDIIPAEQAVRRRLYGDLVRALSTYGAGLP